MKNESGVTLIEVVSCVATFCVIAGIAYPTLENTKSRMAIHSEVSKLVGELHKARVFALKSNSSVVFCYNDSGYKTFIDDGRDGGIKEDWVQQPGEQILADVTLDNRIQIDVEKSSFSLQRTHFTKSPGVKAGAVVMRGCGGSKSKIIVNAIGRVRVEKM